MQGNRYDRGWMPSGRYGRDYRGRMGPAHGPGNHRGYDAPMRRGGYDAQMRGGYDRGWTESMAYGRAPGIAAPGGAGMTSPGMMGMDPGMGMTTPGMFTPFGWDPMMRWSGWDPLAGFVPYQDTPRRWSYGLAQDARGYDHEYYRGNTAHRYDRDHRMPPRQSPTYGRGGDRAVREWARAHGYDVEHTIQPRLRGRR